MRDLVEYIVKFLVSNPDKVVAKEVIGLKVTVIELRVAKEDMGRVIGKEGKTATALRTFLQAAGAKSGRFYNLEIVED